MPKAIVTGGTGLIGRYVIKALLDEGYDVTAFYHSLAPVINHTRLLWIKKDLSEDAIEEIEAEDVDILVHCAAILPGKYKDDHCYAVNKLIDQAVFNFCERNNKIRIIFISGIYLEAGKIEPNTYLYGKLESEQDLIHLDNNSCILRVSSPYGIGQTSVNVMSIFMQRAIKNEPVFFYGTGSRTQDFISVYDIASAVVKVAKSNPDERILNVCSSAPISMKQLALLVKSCLPESTFDIISSGKDDPQEDYRAIFDNSRTKSLLKWEPQVPLVKGVQECLLNLMNKE